MEEGHLHLKKDGDVLGGGLVARTPGDDTEWREVACIRRSKEDTKR